MRYAGRSEGKKTAEKPADRISLSGQTEKGPIMRPRSVRPEGCGVQHVTGEEVFSQTLGEGLHLKRYAIE